MTGASIVIIWLLGLMRVAPPAIHPTVDNNYRAAMYSMVVDFTKAQQIYPEMKYRIPGLTTVSYKYFIQYGKHTLYEIIDAGNEIKSFTCNIKKIDYSAGESSSTAVMDHVKNYHTTSQKFSYTIEESIGCATNLCDDTLLNSRCDSVNFVLSSTGRVYKVLFNDTIANIASRNLFYPDIKYLPYQISGLGRDKNTMTLAKVFYGKSSIDSLLQLCDYNGYDQVYEKDIPPMFRKMALDVIKKYKSMYKE